MKKRGDLSFIDKIEELRAIPSLVVEVTSLLNETFPDTNAVEEKIKMDPAIASFILKFSNSPFLGIRVPLVKLRFAIELIGPTTTKGILMSYFLRNTLKKAAKEEFSNYLWEHSVFVAIISRELAIRLNLKNVCEEAYTAGLLHDIGKYAIYYDDPFDYENLMLEADRDRKALLPLEKDFYGYSHAEVGYYLLNRWRFSDLLKDSVRYHHDIRHYPGGEEVVKLVAFGNSTFHYAIEKQGELPREFLEFYNLSIENYNKIVNSICSIVAEAQLFLLTL